MQAVNRFSIPRVVSSIRYFNTQISQSGLPLGSRKKASEDVETSLAGLDIVLDGIKELSQLRSHGLHQVRLR